MKQNSEQKITARLLIMLLAAALLAFCGIVAETAMNVMFTTLMEEFSIGTAQVQWVTSVYLLVLTVVIPITSFLNKNLPERLNFLLAALPAVIGTVICMLAGSFPMLILGRIIGGVGVGLTLPLLYNLVLTHVPHRIQGTMLGVVNVIICISPAFGPSIGGVVSTYLNWRYLFVILLPFLAAALILGLCSIPKGQAAARTSFDLRGYALIGVVFALLILGTGFSGTYGWISLPVLGLILLAVVLALLFLLHYKHCAEPILRIRVFRFRPFLYGCLVIMMMQINTLSLQIQLPEFSQLFNGETAAVAGLLVLPGSILCAVMMPFTGRIYDKRGPRIPFLSGIVCMLAYMAFCMLFTMRLNTATLIVTYLVYCFGIGMIFSNLQGTAFQSLPAELSADGTAMFNTLQQFGGALGTAVIASVLAAPQSRYAEDLAYATAVGARHGFIMLFVIDCAAAFCLCMILRSRRQKADDAVD